MRTRPIVLALILALTGACSLTGFTADSTADLLHVASPQVNTLEDLQFAEDAIPGSLVTMEAVWRVSPHNKDVLVELAMGWTSYGFAFLEDHIERAQRIDNDDQVQYWRMRAKAAYTRGRMYGLQLMNERNAVEGGPLARVHAGIDPWRRYLATFSSADDVPALFWTANAWLSYIQQSLDDPSAVLDVPFAVAMMERAKVLNPNYFDGGIQMFFGLYYASLPRELGGQPDQSRAAFEAALTLTHRRVLIIQVEYARAYAVMVQDRALFQRLLQEVIDAGDINPSNRLSNQVAKRRARRYLAQIDELFSPADTTAPSAPASSGGAAPQ